jgi:hypothetical protein
MCIEAADLREVGLPGNEIGWIAVNVFLVLMVRLKDCLKGKFLAAVERLLNDSVGEIFMNKN